MATKLCLVYCENLWFQVGELIQDLIILIKNCFFIDVKELNNIWNLFGKDLYLFFKKFTRAELDLLPKISPLILLMGVLRFQPLYNEDKLGILECEIQNNSNIFGNNMAVILFFRELFSIYKTIFSENLTLNLRLQRLLSKKIQSKSSITSFLTLVFLKNTNLIDIQRADKKKKKGFSSRYSDKNISLNSLVSVHQKNLYSRKIKGTLKSGLKMSPDFQFFTTDTIDLEKIDWVFNYALKTLNFSIFWGGKTLKNIYDLGQKNNYERRFYKEFIENLTKYSYRTNLRWSFLSKHLNGSKNFVEKLAFYFLVDSPGQMFLNQERQIISLVRYSAVNNLFRTNNLGDRSFEIQNTLNKLFLMKMKLF